MVDLKEHFEAHGIPWLDCRVDGCNYGMKDVKGEFFIHKKWLIKTTDENFHKTFRAKVCPGNHVHKTIEGRDTSASSYYPWKLVQAIARHWSQQLVPHRHQRLLGLRHDLPSLADMELMESDNESFHMDYNLEDFHDDVNIPEIDFIQPVTVISEPAASARESFRQLVLRRLAQANFSVDALEQILLAASRQSVGHSVHHSRWRDSKGSVLVLGAYSHGHLGGISGATMKNSELVRYVNGFLRQHMPEASWSSVMISFDCPALPHRDYHNEKGSQNHLICVGSFGQGGLWVAGKPPDGRPIVRRKAPDGRLHEGHILQAQRQLVSFDPQAWHASQRWDGYRIAVSAYTTRLASTLPSSDLQCLRQRGFPPPCKVQLSMAAETMTLPEGVDEATFKNWQAQIAKFHKAAGHPTNRNLARIVKEAGHEEWRVQAALDHQCPACQSLKLGGTSSGQIPPASTMGLVPAWHSVGVDTGEWVVPHSKHKVKFLVFVDVATKLWVVHPLYIYDIVAMRTETTEDVTRAFTERWLSTFPKPQVLMMDSGKSFISESFHEFASSLNIQVHFVAEKEHWAHGIVEAVVQDIKMTASAIQLEALDQDYMVTLHLAASALNSTEYTAGYSAFQWAFGQQYSLSDEDVRTFHGSDFRGEFVKLITARQQAEQVATKTRAKRILSKLANSTVRQPLRQFTPMDLVKIWRRVWPKQQYQGPRGGLRKSGRPHWVGPGRVVFSEVLPHQQAGDDRRHVVWVLIGSQLYRCSVHSVRPVTEVERFQYETSGEEQPSQWRSLRDILPQREYTDLTDQVPHADEVERPDLPPEPDSSTVVAPPSRRVRFKKPQEPEPLPEQDQQESAGPPSSSTTRPNTEVNDYDQPSTEPAAKKPKQDNWVEQLHAEALFEEANDLFTFLETADDDMECLKLEFEIGDLSNRQRKFLERNPVAFMVKKLRDSEVSLTKLSAVERLLFVRAKAKDVDSFIKNEAVRKCQNREEVRSAFDNKRVVRARWVLTWKSVPPEDQLAAKDDARDNPTTTHTASGTKKAKARIVLLGFEHPSLLDSNYKTSSPVQSTLGRNLLYSMAAHKQWELEGLDLSTAFLQTQPTEADRDLWTSGVAELREALGVGEEGIMKILRNIYGSTTAPRGLWLDLHKTLTSLGAQPVLGERCLWIWLSKHRLDGDRPLTIGAMGGHVDDFHRIGDSSDEWLSIKKAIDKAYTWGMIKSGSYRHAGTDVKTSVDERGWKFITVSQECYIESLMDVDISPDRLRSQGELHKSEIDACRTALGSLQWLAVQSQPQLCARCNLLLTELVTNGTLETAREIQLMISEVRQEAYTLKFRRLPDVHHWTDVIFVSMGDQAHGNRPRGDSTGGMITLLSGPSCIHGHICEMDVLSWRTWKLKRKAIGSNDAEVQSVLEAEDCNFRARLLWSELHGAGGLHPARAQREDLVDVMEQQALRVKGIVCTDSRGGYDAVEVNESPLLGLSNMRAALQAFQLRDNLRRTGTELRWLASDYDLADALTKRKAEARQGLLRFLQTGRWAIKYDPLFRSAKKSKRAGKSALDVIKLLYDDGIDVDHFPNQELCS